MNIKKIVTQIVVACLLLLPIASMASPPVSSFVNLVPADKKVSYELSGYLTQASYLNRKPDWENDKEYATYDEALKKGTVWQQRNGPDSTVELIETQGKSGVVKAVIDNSGIEIIQ